MPLNKRDTLTYRHDERFGHKLLAAQDRIKLIEPYLPPTPAEQAAARQQAAKGSRLGVRRFLKAQLHLLVFNIFHTVFSIYIRFRRAYHTLCIAMFSLFHYHHRTPELIAWDFGGLRKLPSHVSVVLKLDRDARGGLDLDKLVNEASDLTAWCVSAGIPELSIYEKTGTLKNHLAATHRALQQKLSIYFGRELPGLTLRIPHHQPVSSTSSVSRGSSPTENGLFSRSSSPEPLKHMSVLLLSAEDARDPLVDLTKTLAEMAQRGKINPADVSIDLVDTGLTEAIMGEPDLLILFSPFVHLDGFPPWPLRLTEIYHAQDNNHNVCYYVFYHALKKYANARMRFGRPARKVQVGHQMRGLFKQAASVDSFRSFVILHDETEVNH